MPRKAFLADLQAVQASLPARGIHNVELGDEDGTITFAFDPTADGHGGIAISALIPDLSAYPISHVYLLYTISDHVPAGVNTALADPAIFNGHSLPSMLAKVSTVLAHAMATSREQSPTAEEENDSEPQDDASDEAAGSDSLDDTFFDEMGDLPSSSEDSGHPITMSSTDGVFRARVRSDLLAIKKAGFRISYYGDLYARTACHLVLSCRVAKLRIPDDALKAWHLDRELYLVLLMRYPHGYRVLEDLTLDPSSRRALVELRVGTSKKSRTSFRATTAAFGKTPARDSASKTSAAEEPTQPIAHAIDEYTLQGLFIGRPLDDVLNTRLLDLIRDRISMAVPWSRAESLDREKRGPKIEDPAKAPAYHPAKENASQASHLPALVTADHLAETSEAYSFPLVAMQFALRRLVRCTEFCLVCHCTIDNGFEALKPYVCDKPLCLYQYMSLGFGPSIEHEILTQPYVVDMLISLCYASAAQEGIRDLPAGLALKIPSIDRLYNDEPALLPAQALSTFARTARAMLKRATPGATFPAFVPPGLSTLKFKATFNTTTSELAVAPHGPQRRFHLGDWICMVHPLHVDTWPLEHRMVTRIDPVLQLGAPLPSFAAATPEAQSTAGNPSAASRIIHVNILPYDANFDDLSGGHKHAAIILLLDTLPTVLEMRAYLQRQPAGQASLQSWTERLTPAALSLLRWIIASNRSHLIQVDSLDATGPSEDRVLGMKNYMQFRFAQGAPSKERRFITAVRNTQKRLSLTHPTLFAWHGSPLKNWHGIIREGLNYDVTAHGRAYGSGVYLSLAASTSQGFSATSKSWPNSGIEDEWRQSIIKVRHAICLNEVVNAPREFVCHSPHLVVDQLDWIQPCYLFVSCHAREESHEAVEQGPGQILLHDPERIPLGMDGTAIVMPIAAIGRSRQPYITGLKKGHKKHGIASKRRATDDYPSDESDADELQIFTEPVDTSDILVVPSNEASRTPFAPGSLDVETLSLMAEPPYATPLATRTLQGMLAQALKLQKTEPPYILGWHVSPNLDTVYQWIVELHSFDLDLPLAQDMQLHQIHSVVLEFRFGKDFPYSPPFVRVVRPRFLALLEGGGGHVTTGGAICMELLTNSGWNPASSIEAILLQIRMAITSTDPPALLSSGCDYPIAGAIAAYQRACRTHGWIVPDDFAVISKDILAKTSPTT